VSAAAKLALMSILIGGVLGLLVLGAAAAAGRPRKLPFWLGGTAWGVVAIMLVMTDCVHPGLGPGKVAGVAFPIYFAGLVGFPVAMVWGQRPWLLRWFLAQVVLLVSIAPAFLAAVVSALCTFQ
jgi:hypothetical protein